MTTAFRAGVPTRVPDRLSSLLLHWNSNDQSVDALSGQAGSFERTTLGGAMVDALGNVWQSVRRQPRWEMVLDAATGRYRPGLLLEPAKQNLIFPSEDFSAWTNIGTADVATGVLHGDLQLIAINDNAAGTLEGRSKTVAFGSTAVKFLRVTVHQDSSTSSVIRLRDTTASANRLLATITWNGDGSPAVAMTTGVFIGSRYLPSQGSWELLFQTTSVTHTNTNQVEVYPATTSALATSGTGTIQMGGIGVYDAVVPRSYLKTTGSPSASSLGESLSWPFPFPRRRIWLYLDFTEQGSYLLQGAGSGYCALGVISGTGVGIYPSSGAPGYSCFHYVGGSGAAASVVGSYGTYGQRVEVLVTMDATGKPTIEIAKDGVSIGSSTGGSSPADMTTALTNATAYLGAFGASATHVVGAAAYHCLKAGEFGLGTPTLAQARRYW